MPLAASTEPADRLGDLPDVLQFMQLLWAVVHGLETTSKRMSSDLGVTGPQRLVLRVVGLFPDVSAGDVAQVLHIHPSTLTGVLQRLMAQRRLRRVDHPGDRRRAMLRLTARGARVNATTHGTIESAVAKALDGVTVRDRAATRRVLEGLARCLESPSRARASGVPRKRRPSRGPSGGHA
jgi:DNA-binding MarR family transcriptional regulator